MSRWSRKLKSAKLKIRSREKQRDKVCCKNSLEYYTFNMKATVEGEKLQDRINGEDKHKILDKYNEIFNRLDKNRIAEKEEFEL